MFFFLVATELFSIDPFCFLVSRGACSTDAAAYPPRCTVGLISKYPRVGSPTVGKTTTWLGPGEEGGPPV